jgi:TM2 domain-containing membrane protein YozV
MRSPRHVAVVFILLGASCFPRHGSAQVAPANTPARVAADSDSVRVVLKKRSPAAAMLRSLIVPGWGQLYNGRHLHAALVFGAEAGLLAAAISWDRQAKATAGDEQFFNRDYRNITIGWLAGTVVLSATDAYVDARRSDRIGLKEKRNPTGALLRSLIFPGWGQFYNRKFSKAFLFLGSEAGLMATAIHLNQQAVSTSGDLQATYRNNRNTANWFLLATIVFSMLDAYVDASLADFDESPELSLVPPGSGAGAMIFRVKIKL